MSQRTDTTLSVEGPRRARVRSILHAWWTGWELALRMPGIVILKWLVNLGFAAVAVLPVALLLTDHLADSVAGEQAFESMGIDIAAEFVLAAWPQLRLAAMAAVPIALAYPFVNLYLTGGILHRLRAGLREPWAGFFGACNRNLFPLIRVGLMTLLLAALVLGLPHYALGRLVSALTENATGPQPLFYLTWLHWAIVLLFASWVARVYDYARIAVFLQPTSKATTAFVRGIEFTLRRGTETLGLWLLLVLPPLLLTVLFATAPIAGGVATTAAMWVSLALGQALLALRILGSFAALGGQMRFMQRAQRP